MNTSRTLQILLVGIYGTISFSFCPPKGLKYQLFGQTTSYTTDGFERFMEKDSELELILNKQNELQHKITLLVLYIEECTSNLDEINLQLDIVAGREGEGAKQCVDELRSVQTDLQDEKDEYQKDMQSIDQQLVKLSEQRERRLAFLKENFDSNNFVDITSKNYSEEEADSLVTKQEDLPSHQNLFKRIFKRKIKDNNETKFPQIPSRKNAW